MRSRTRRAVLGAAGSLLLGFSGCSDSGTPVSSTATATATPIHGTLHFDPVPVSDIDTDARVVVYPPTLRRWLREAVSAGTTLRAHAKARVTMPRPPLPAFDRVRLTDPESDADGQYEVRATGGIRYRYLAGARAVDPPAAATVTPVSDLEAKRREFVRTATNESSGGAAFYPETKLGEWARTEFFGGYFRRNGTVYRGRELEQTDAAFFSRKCWYILSLASVDGAVGRVLDLQRLDDDVRSGVDELLDSRNPGERVERDAAAVPQAVRQFVAETDYLLTHSAVFDMRVEHDG